MKGAPVSPPWAQQDELELPHLWQKPALQELFKCLQGLRQELPVWNLDMPRAEIIRQREEEQQASAAHDRREIVSFLSAIVSSGLAWLESDDEREEVWSEASKRLAERCGRTAMGDITRCWPFKDREYGAFDLAIREPSITGDSLGLKTWGSSYVLAQLLHKFAAGPLAHLFPTDGGTGGKTKPSEILELGSGTGLLGLAAACIWKTHVFLTDLPAIMPNLAHNAGLNLATVEERGGHVDAAALTWGSNEEEETDPQFTAGNRFQLILVADPLYDDNHPALLAGAIDGQLGLGPDSRALVMVPQRDEITKGLTGALREEMARQTNPLVCISECLVPGQDDWETRGDDDEAANVGFWWGVFKRQQNTACSS
ncbi:putative methyltransferase-domain-containing protein [Lasiosphaeria miniovina]|uniref:Methyltransferase-domain-containing protein n=1 Tax=Lasiosphaeria miniovina TaxID=1954250 RepID=A0AA40BHI1_9PEZI|nr:putative methyltransferase-domain-containing protein [Lasiosphaeria miniovina]KAK0734337.1 putative methyltransferase-domain-containing protein [Lasiosphaeria miniovina]